MIRFWCDFAVILMWFWYDSDMCSSYFRTFDPHLNHNFDLYQNHNWNHIKIITAKPGHKQTITTKHSWSISKPFRHVYQKKKHKNNSIPAASDVTIINLWYKAAENYVWHMVMQVFIYYIRLYTVNIHVYVCINLCM